MSRTKWSRWTAAILGLAAFWSAETARATTGNGSGAAAPIVVWDANGANYEYGVANTGGLYGKGGVYEWYGPGSHTLIYSFGQGTNDGANGVGQLSFNQYDNCLYGITARGGRFNYGSVFRICPQRLTGVAQVYQQLYSFDGTAVGATPTSLLAVGSAAAPNTTVLYGTTYAGNTVYGSENGSTSASTAGNIFKLTVSNSGSAPSVQATLLHGLYSPLDGLQPLGQLLSLNGVLYGTTQAGGAYNGGTIFSINPTNGAFSTLLSFGGYAGAAYSPRCGLIQGYGPDANKLLGTTRYGGSSSQYGAIFSFDLTAPPASAFTQLHAFTGLDGVYPCGLTVDTYESSKYGPVYVGITNNGGASYVNNSSLGYGALYFYTANGNGSAPTALKPGFNLFLSFDNTKGKLPAGPLAYADPPLNHDQVPSHSYLFGVTTSGLPQYFGQQGNGGLWQMYTMYDTSFDWRIGTQGIRSVSVFTD